MFLFLAGLAFGKRSMAEKGFTMEELPNKPRRQRTRRRALNATSLPDMPRRRALNATSLLEDLPDLPRRRVNEVGWNNCGRNEAFNIRGRNRCSHSNECHGRRTCSGGGWCHGHSHCPHCGKTQKMNCKQNCPGDGWEKIKTTNHGCCSSWSSCGGNMKTCKWNHPQACGGLSPGTKCFTVSVHVKHWGSEMSYDIAGCRDSPSLSRKTWSNGSVQSKRCCVYTASSYTMYCKDSYGDGWHGGSIYINGRIRLCQNFKRGRSYTETVRI